MQTHNKKLTRKDISLIVFKSPISISRLRANDKDFPKPKIIGRSSFFDTIDFYKWLSDKAKKEVTASDTLMTGMHLQDYFQKSHTWIWQQVKAGNLPKPFKINRTNYWLERDIMNQEVA